MTIPLESAIVRIRAVDGSVMGAGFLVSERYILTCAHVVARALDLPETASELPRAEVCLDFPLLSIQQKFIAQVVHWQPDIDVAGLELTERLPAGTQAARLVSADDWWEHPFRAFGFPAGFDAGVWASGLLRGKQANGWVQIEDVKQTGYFVQPGFSGGPVWDNELNGIAGMTVAADTSENIRAAFIIPTDLLIKSWPILDEQSIPPCPYRGLSAFREQDTPFFFGRETFVEKLVGAVRQQPLTAVLGASGSGKSSIVFAGLVPKLRQEKIWIIANLRPGTDPFKALASALLPLYEISLDRTDQLVKIPKLANYLREGELSVDDIVASIIQTQVNVELNQFGLPAVSTSSTPRVLLIIDQFEELFTLCTDVHTRCRFLDILLDAMQISSSPLRILLTLRADFLGQILTHRNMADALQNADLKLGPMNQQELELAVEKPATKLGVAFESGLVKRILDDVGDEAGNLPLLEFALTLLWERQRCNRLSHQAYDAIGWVKGALTHYADTTYTRLDPVEQDQARRIFVQLVSPGEGTVDTRRLATQRELVSNWSVVQDLANARLIVTDVNAESVETCEVVHEALIQNWDRLRQWLNEDRAFRTWQERLRSTLRQWQATNKDKGALLRGTLLTEAENWLTKRDLDLSLGEVSFISTSLQIREQEQEETKRLKLAEERSRMIAQTMAALSSTLDYRKVLRLVAEQAVSALSDSRLDTDSLIAIVLLFEGNEDKLTIVAGRNVVVSEQSLRIDSSRGVIGSAIETSEVVISHNIEDDEVLSKLKSASVARSAICAPLRTEKYTYGVILFLSSETNVFNSEHKNFLKIFADQAILALQNAQLFQDIQNEKEKLRELERQRLNKLARQLHDGAVQALAAIVMRANFIKKLIEDTKVDKALDEIRKVEELGTHATRELRTTLFTLRPVILETQGLVAALKALAERINNCEAFQITVIDQGFNEKQINSAAKGVVFAVVEEAVTNVKKYAHASKVTIALTPHQETLTVEIQDNGTEFDTEQLRTNFDQTTYLGLNAIFERTELIGGLCSIESSLGSGTLIRIQIPLVDGSTSRVE